MTETFSVHIYPSDCDSVGHVNHAHMLTLLERARWSALEAHMTYDEYMKSNLWAVVRKVEASYMAQTFPGDEHHGALVEKHMGEVEEQADAIVARLTGEPAQ